VSPLLRAVTTDHLDPPIAPRIADPLLQLHQRMGFRGPRRAVVLLYLVVRASAVEAPRVQHPVPVLYEGSYARAVLREHELLDPVPVGRTQKVIRVVAEHVPH
jgi:hypothetical protein